MGCSSSAQTQDSKRPAAKPSDTNGLQKCATSDENSPTTDENETIPDQTKLDPMEDVDLSPEETKPSENLPAEETEVLIPGPAECVNSNYKKVDLEGTEPLAAGPPEATGSLVEGTGILPPAGAAEGTGIPPPAGVAEGSVSPVTEIIRKVQINEEDQLIEGETGEKVETEKLSELVSEGTETKEEETGEAADATAATEIEATNIEE
ncbi:glutamate-rich protein 5 isoform X2 [Emydura macquarii macquarii]|uniref:glutamate-rich protein 5 isoform X2 n=1 Tax=Emydura macquarii macquarii TaxID=1129001 RepID=UPI00352B242C